jgi:tetratricopeptide (TPR) repeat protein
VTEEWRADGFFQVGGALDPNAPSYVTRQADEELMQTALSGEYCSVLTARQLGKSSLMVRTVNRLKSRAIRTVVIDLTAIGIEEVSDSEWYFGLISQLRRQLDLTLDEVAWWKEQSQLGPLQRFSEFVRHVVLKEVQESIVVFIDEIDSTLNLPFSDDFFAAIRAFHNARASDLAYKRLTFVLLGVARPGDLIKDRSRTPYNIGLSIDLNDFTMEEAQELLPGLKAVSSEQADAILERVLYWTGGHPYLTQRVCAAIVAEDNEWTDAQIDALVKRLFLTQEARKDTNLQFIRDRVRVGRERARILRIYRRVLAGKRVADEERSAVKSQLKLTGLVKATSGGDLVVRNRVYETVFNRRWIKENIPVSPRQRVNIVATAIAILTILFAGLLFYREQTRPAEVRAELFTNGFLNATSPEVRLSNLAGLLRLRGYEDQARDLFFELDANQRLEMFKGLGNPEQLGQDVLIVVEEVYQDHRLGNIAEHNQLLRTMAEVLHKVEGDNVPGAKALAMEIDYWLTGRQQANKGDFAAAVEHYTLALGLRDDNPSVLFERGLAYAKLGEPTQALADFEGVLNLNSDWRERVQYIVESNPQLYVTLWNDRRTYQLLAMSISTPTPTSTAQPVAVHPTATMTPMPTSTATTTPTNTPLPTSTYTATPTDTATPIDTATPTSTPTPEVSPTPEVLPLTIETFDNNINRWPTPEYDGYLNYELVNGEYYMTVTGLAPDFFDAVTCASCFTSGDFAYKVQTRIELIDTYKSYFSDEEAPKRYMEDETVEYGLAFNINEDFSSFRYFVIQGSNVIFGQLYDDERRVIAGPQHFSSIAQGPDAFNNLKLECTSSGSGSEITLFVNGEPWNTFAIDENCDGYRFGLTRTGSLVDHRRPGIYFGGAPTPYLSIIAFDNIQVDRR